jgi:hypothetical protein
MGKNVSGRENCSLSVRFALNVGTGVLDGPQISLIRQRFLVERWRTVEDAGPYGFIFKPTNNPKFEPQHKKQLPMGSPLR